MAAAFLCRTASCTLAGALFSRSFSHLRLMSPAAAPTQAGSIPLSSASVSSHISSKPASRSIGSACEDTDPPGVPGSSVPSR